MIETITTLFSAHIFVYLVLGVLVGFVIGALPGFDITTGVALLLPLTYVMGPDQAIVFFSAMYCSGVFGGSITAILFKIPGTSESVMTAEEGYPFTQQGLPGKALGMAIVCSGVGGILSGIVMLVLTPLLASLALKFGPGDYAALGILGLSCVSSAAGSQLLKGLGATALGLLLATVGIDHVSGTPRFIVDRSLDGGIHLVAAIIGLFAVAEVFRLIAAPGQTLPQDNKLSLKFINYPKLQEYLSVKWTIFRSWVIGLVIGILPGAGASAAAFIAHGVEKRINQNPEEFGKGKLEGVAAPETANNSAAVGALIPLLALGIPGSATAAVIIGAFAIHNLQPGPLLLIQQPELINTVLGSVLLANILFVLFAFVLVRFLAMLTLLPYPILAVSILTVSIGGAIAIGGIPAVMVMLFFAVLGIIMIWLKVPMPPLILGFVLGPIIEIPLRRALIFTNGEFLPLLYSPVTDALLLISALFLFGPSVLSYIRSRGG